MFGYVIGNLEATPRGKMPAEPLLFIFVIAFTQFAMLYSVARLRPGIVLHLGLYTAPFTLGLGFWFIRIQSHSGFNAMTGGVLGFVLIATFAAYYEIDRRLRVKEGLVFPPTGILSFQETGASGRGSDSFVMRLFGARRCLVVTVTENELWVRPTGPFLAMARSCGLLHRVPLVRIHLMERLVGPAANVRLEYTDRDDWCRCVELKLRNPAAFVEAIREGQLEESA
jgi:hypothetical protein